MRYRLLEEMEVVKENDEFFCLVNHSWAKINAKYSGITPGSRYTNNLTPIRRRIEEPKTKSCESCMHESREWAKFCQNCGKEFAKPVYRLLREGENLQIGDEYWLNRDREWVVFEEDTVKHSVASDNPTRRKIRSFTD